MTPRRTGLLVALFLGAVALRPQIVGIGPLLPEIQDDLDMSHAAAGLLGTIPVLCMGAFAPPAPYLSGRLGTRFAIAASLGLIGVAGLARAGAPDAALLVVLTFPVGVGIGLAGAIMPVAVKERFPDRPAFSTGVYTTGINVGSALASALAVPIAALAGGWRASLVAFSAVTVGLAGLWVLQTRREPPHERTPFRPPRLPLRSRTAWTLVAVFALLGTSYYGLNAWLPDSYVERGWSEGSAGALLAVLNFAAIPAGFAVSWLADRHGSRRFYLVTGAATQLGCLLGIILLPGGAWLWVALFGAVNGVMFALVMTLPLDVAGTPAGVGAVAGLMLGAGYCLAALSPLALGVARDVTGSFTTALWVIAGTAALLLALCTTLTRERLHRGVAEQPASA
jgi:CP family cyanate transporter-like MFS transporter